jgi:3-oxoacyl-[acyl-carrier protein] reductase
VVVVSTGNGFAGRAALVTGGSRGIGAAIVRRLAGEGADVAFSYSTGQAEATDLAREVQESGSSAIPIQADLARPESAAALADAALGRLGKLDILVNNAGVTFWAPLARIPLEEFDRLVAVDARAPFAMMQAAADTLSDGGRVINVSSAVTSTALAGSSLYSGV